MGDGFLLGRGEERRGKAAGFNCYGVKRMCHIRGKEKSTRCSTLLNCFQGNVTPIRLSFAKRSRTFSNPN